MALRSPAVVGGVRELSKVRSFLRDCPDERQRPLLTISLIIAITLSSLRREEPCIAILIISRTRKESGSLAKAGEEVRTGIVAWKGRETITLVRVVAAAPVSPVGPPMPSPPSPVSSLRRMSQTTTPFATATKGTCGKEPRERGTGQESTKEGHLSVTGKALSMGVRGTEGWLTLAAITMPVTMLSGIMTNGMMMMLAATIAAAVMTVSLRPAIATTAELSDGATLSPKITMATAPTNAAALMTMTMTPATIGAGLARPTVSTYAAAAVTTP